MYMVLMMLGRQMRTAKPLLSETLLFDVEIALQNLETLNYQVVIKFLKNLFKQTVMHYVLRSTNLLILFRIRKICYSSGRNPLL
jgi:hypothetical protein